MRGFIKKINAHKTFFESLKKQKIKKCSDNKNIQNF